MAGRRWRADVLLLLGAAGLVVMLARQNRALKGEAAALHRRLSTPQPGTYVPTVRAVSLLGDSVTIGEGGPATRQVLLFFTTTCPYCVASLPAWRRLAAALAPETGVRLIGVSLDSSSKAATYARVHGLSFPVVTFTQRKHVVLYRARSVPLVLVLDSEGRVRYSRVGELSTKAAFDSVLAAAHGGSSSSVAGASR